MSTKLGEVQYYEKNVNLSVALAVKDTLDYGGIIYSYIFTRTSDQYVNLIDRATLANDSNVSAFISIHHNSDNDSTIQYTVTLWSTFPTVDGDTLELIDIADLVYLVDYMFGNPNGPAPPCMDEANIDGLVGIDIDDLVYLVAYMYSNGPQPADCP